MSNIERGLLVAACVIGIVAGGIFVFKSTGVGCVDWFFGKSCGVTIVR